MQRSQHMIGMRDAPDPLTPLWHATAPRFVEPVATRNNLSSLAVDTLVIGAGVTGLSTALHLAERGARVAVLERDGPGLGSSGRANGQIIAGLQKDPDALIAAFGTEQGERMVEFAGRAPDLLFELIARHGIACDAERTGWVQATRSAREMKSLERLAASWARRDAPVRMLDRGEITRLLGTDAYAGGWLDQRNGSIQPLAYARGLASAAVAAGAEAHYGVEVGELRRERGIWRVSTNCGELSAATVVLATNVYTSQLRGVARTFLGRTYLSAYSVQLATEPLDEALLRRVLPERHTAADTEHVRLRYFRLDREGRFVIGGPGWLTPPRSASAASFRVLESSMRRMFPQLARVRVDYRWAARDTLTPDLLPHLYEPCPGLYSALGYNGRGLAIGTALGSVLARRVLGEPAETLPYPTTRASSLPLNLPSAAAYYAKVALARLRR